MLKINIRRFRILKKQNTKQIAKGHKQNTKSAHVSLDGKTPPNGLVIGEPGPSRHMSGKDAIRREWMI